MKVGPALLRLRSAGLSHCSLVTTTRATTKDAKGREVPTKDQFRSEIRSQLRSAELRGAATLDINSGLVHRQLGAYPAPNNTEYRFYICWAIHLPREIDVDRAVLRFARHFLT